MTVVLLDPYHLGDPLFVSQLARDVAARGAGSQSEGLVLVHGSGEAGERALEARGAAPVAHGGVWAVASADEAAEVERATRDLNRRLVHEMNEAGVPAVRVMASDRGLVARGPDGALRAGRTGWLATLATQGGVALVAALVAAEPGRGEALAEVDASEAAAVLAEALGAEAVVLLATGRIVASDGALSLREATAMVPDRGLAERLIGHLSGTSRVPVRLAAVAQLRVPGAVAGMRLVA
jgi:acetylglutamate kinase